MTIRIPVRAFENLNYKAILSEDSSLNRSVNWISEEDHLRKNNVLRAALEIRLDRMVLLKSRKNFRFLQTLAGKNR